MELEPLEIWEGAPHLSVKKLWEWLTNYCYLPRLANQSVLESTIKAGLEDMFPPFAYATGVDRDGEYEGLKLKGPFTLYFDQHDLLVQPEIARAQREKELAKKTGTVEPIIDPPPPDPVDPPPDAPLPQPKPKTRYYGSVQIDPQRAMRDLSQIADEIIVRLASVPGADVTITVEIEGLHGEGFDDATVRTINENSRTLNFNSHDFEE